MSNCPVCLFEGPAKFEEKNGYSFLECKKCKLIFVWPQPGLDEFKNIYSSKTGYHAKLENKIDKKFLRIIKYIEKTGLKGNLLDVGCSNGKFMRFSRERGFNPKGVEINRDSARIAAEKGLDVFVGELHKANFPENYFSVVRLGDVLEHVPDPVGLIKECRRILKEDGILIVSTPNIDCFWAKLTKSLHNFLKIPWPVLIPPYHLFLFSEENLKNLLSKLNFKILDISFSNCSLRHDIAATGLLQRAVKEKSFKKLIYSAAVFLIIFIAYAIYSIARIFSKKDFGMTISAKKL